MTITLEKANKVTTLKQTASLVGQTAKEYVEAGEKISAIEGGRTYAAALATHAAMRTGYLASGANVPNGAVNRSEYAALFGVSPSTVTRWALNARCFVDLGVTPESDLGKALIQGRANDIGSKVINAEDATPESIAEALDAAGFTPTGTRKPKSEDDKGKGKGPDVKSTDADSTTPALPRNDTTRLDMVETLLSAMSKNPGKAERERFAALVGAWCQTWKVTPEGFAPVEADAEAVAS